MYTFIPTFAPSSVAQQYSQGSIINYDEWTSQYVTGTVTLPSGGVARFAVISLSVIAAFVGGAALALA
jgi:hypothetical protein